MNSFLSTPSARRATVDLVFIPQKVIISIHALREEGDGSAIKDSKKLPVFLSTPSARRATATPGVAKRFTSISIHALREEGDQSMVSQTAQAAHFYPRPPRGGRQKLSLDELKKIAFLSTPSARRATKLEDLFMGDFRFLSTPSARRATTGGMPSPRAVKDFYPRPPRGGRLVKTHSDIPEKVFLSTPSARRATAGFIGVSCDITISIHALREEGDVREMAAESNDKISIHALREEGDNAYKILEETLNLFLSTPSARRATRAGCF